MALEDYRIDMEGCSRCSCCKFIPMEKITGDRFAHGCPSISKYNFHAYSAGGRLNFGEALLSGRIDYTDELLDIIYKCQMCGSCDVSCKYLRDMETLESLHAIRVQCVQDGQLIPAHMLILESMKKEDNTLQKPKAERGKWAEGLAIKDINKEKAEVVYFAGCLASFNEELWPAVRGAINLLHKVGVDVGIAGKEEVCCGCRAYDMGYEAELIKYAEHNMQVLKNAGAKTLVTSCADGYQAFKVIYPKMGKELGVEVLHITEYLARLLKEKKLKLTKEVPMTVTYHDPCHLGRLGEPYIPYEGKRISTPIMLWDPPREYRRGTYGIYEPPRDILKSIPGLKFVEMERIKEFAWCCGAGGGVSDAYPEFAEWTAVDRIEEAKATGAEAIVTACGWCNKTFRDALTKTGDKLKVLDIMDILQQAI